MAASDAEDLVAFLQDRNRPEVRSAALDIISGLTASADGIAQLGPVQARLLGALLRLVPCSSASDATTNSAKADPAASSELELSRAALTALVNLTQEQAWAVAALQHSAVARVMEFIRDKACPHMELLLMLLVNVTVPEAGCEQLLQLGKAGMEGLHMAMLLKAFVTSAVTLLPDQPDPYEHIAALLTNATRLKAGRQMLLQPGRGTLQALAAQLQPGCGLGRRRGCAGALRNVCISAEADGTLAELVADEAVLARLLAPLGGGQPAAAAAAAAPPAAADADSSDADSSELHEQMNGLSVAGSTGNGQAGTTAAAPRDPDDGVREALAEAIAVLAGTEAGRHALLKVSAPELLRKAYEDEEHPGVCNAMEAAARSFLFECDGTAVETHGDGGGGEQQLAGPDTPQPTAA